MGGKGTIGNPSPSQYNNYMFGAASGKKLKATPNNATINGTSVGGAPCYSTKNELKPEAKDQHQQNHA